MFASVCVLYATFCNVCIFIPASWVTLAGSNCWALLAVWGLCGLCVVPCTKVLKVSAYYDHKKRQLVQQFRSAASGNVLYAVACKPDPHLSIAVLMRRLEGKLHHALNKSRFHPLVFLGQGKPIHPGTKIECTKKNHVIKRLTTKTPRELVRWLQHIVDDEYDEFECFDLDGWEARRIRAVTPYRPAGYH